MGKILLDGEMREMYRSRSDVGRRATNLYERAADVQYLAFEVIFIDAVQNLVDRKLIAVIN